MRIPELVFGGMVLAGIFMMILGSLMRHARQAEVSTRQCAVAAESNATSSIGTIAPEIKSLDDSSQSAGTTADFAK